MKERTDVDLSAVTTLRVGGRALRYVEVDTRDELVELARSLGRECLVIGSGSNLVVSQQGVDVPVIAVRSQGVEVQADGERAVLRVAAGESWDELVYRCVTEGFSGVEALSGIPGTVGATPIQNVGAYGQEVSGVIREVDVLDRTTGHVSTMSSADCLFRYRSSVFREQPDRYIVVEVVFELRRSGDSAPIRYPELAARLRAELGSTAPLSLVREEVLALRRSKGMVLDDSDHDTWSAGSFFINPILEESELPDDAPHWLQPDGTVKTSAAWLIERAGFGKGYGAELTGGRVTLSTKHTLAVTNRGGATTDDVLTLARVVQAGVRDRFGIVLRPEPTLVAVQL